MLIGYARVSTRDQNTNLQIDALRAADCEKIFEETASGAQRDRPQLKAALGYLRNGTDDVLVVWKLDRLARSTKQLIETIELLDQRKIGFRCLTQSGIDTTTPSGRLVFTVFSAIAEFERDNLRERTRAGLDAARSRGKIGGRPPALSPKDVTAAKAMLADREISVEDVARRLNVSSATLYRHLPGGRSAVLPVQVVAP
jgi:DNA invertase Pin-like site-specific DNA recombinase